MQVSGATGVEPSGHTCRVHLPAGVRVADGQRQVRKGPGETREDTPAEHTCRPEYGLESATLGGQGLQRGVTSRLGSTGPGWAAARLSLGCRRPPAYTWWYSYAEPIGSAARASLSLGCARALV